MDVRSFPSDVRKTREGNPSLGGKKREGRRKRSPFPQRAL